MKTLRGHLSGLITVFVVLLTASAALGAVGALTETEEPTDPVVCVPVDTEPVEDGDEVDVGLLSTEEGEGPIEGDPVEEPCEEEETEEPTEDPVEGEDGDGEDGEGEDGEQVAPVTDEERTAACEEAAGIEPPVEGDEGSTEVVDGEEEKLTGLDNAIQHVLANCVKNPQAPGLLNALARLHENQERHAAHALAKEERAAEREARKAEREAAKASGVHGNGNGHGGGNGNGNGKANGNGHGNGH